MKHLFLPAFSALLLLCAACNEKTQNGASASGGVMNLTSDPDGAEITILGKSAGTTPKTTNPVPAAMYIVKVSKDGYEPAWRAVNVSAGRRTESMP